MRAQRGPDLHPDRLNAIQGGHRRVKVLLAGAVGLALVGFGALSMKSADGPAPPAASIRAQAEAPAPAAPAIVAPAPAAPSALAEQAKAFMADLQGFGAACELAGDNAQTHLGEGSVQEAYSWSVAAQDACGTARAEVLTKLKPPEMADKALRDEFAHVIDTCATRFGADIKTFKALAEALDGGLAPSQVEHVKDLVDWSNIYKGGCDDGVAEAVEKAGGNAAG